MPTEDAKTYYAKLLKSVEDTGRKLAVVRANPKATRSSTPRTKDGRLDLRGCVSCKEKMRNAMLARALKPGTPEVKSLDLNLSDRCNLACSFCYARENDGLGPDIERTKRFLSWFGNVRRALRGRGSTVLSSKVTFYGGEPLVEFDDLQASVNWMREEYSDINPSFGIVTNMTLLDEDKLKWLFDNKVRIQCSIDGCPEAQDTLRTYENGNGTSRVVYENARRVLKLLPGAACRATVTPKTAHLLFESVRFLVEEVGFAKVNPVLAGGSVWRPDQVESLVEEFRRLCDWWMQKLRKGRLIECYFMNHIIPDLIRGKRGTGRCGAGRALVAFDTRGTLWPCHRFCNTRSYSPEILNRFKLGDIETGYTNVGLTEELESIHLGKRDAALCFGCGAADVCRNNCLHESVLEGESEDLYSRRPNHCLIWPLLVKEIREVHQTMVMEKNVLYRERYLELRTKGSKGQRKGTKK